MQSTLTIRIAVSAVLPLAVVLTPMAHHSTAEFDYTQTVTIEGVVNEVQWTNPHSFLQVLVSIEDSDTPQQWSIEIGSPALNARAGWRRDSVKVGDPVFDRKLLPDGRLENRFTIEDPKFYTFAWEASATFRRDPNAKVSDDICPDRIGADHDHANAARTGPAVRDAAHDPARADECRASG